MPEYPFEDVKTGELVDVNMSADACVPIGKTIRRAGRSLRRLASNACPAVEPNWAHTCFSMSDEDAKKYAPRVDANGFGVFDTRRQIENAQAKMAADGRQPWTYDFGAHKRKRAVQ